MLNGDEKEKPRAQRQEALHHHPQAHTEHLAEQTQFEFRQPIEGVTTIVDFQHGVRHKEEHGNAARQRRGNGRPGDAERRTTEVPEHQSIVEHHVGQDHHHGVVFEHPRLRGAHKKGTKQTGHHAEIDAPHAPIQVGPGGVIHGVGRNDGAQHRRRKALRADEQEGGEQREEDQAVPKHTADVLGFVLAVAPPHEDLCPGTESENQHEHGDEEDAAERRGSQLDFAHTSQKGRVGHAHQLLNDRTEHQREGNFPNITIRIARAT